MMEEEGLTIRQVAEAALAEIDKLEKKRIQFSSPREVIREVFKGLQDPKPAEENFVPVHPLPTLPPEWPKLLVSYTGAGEWIIVNSFAEWAPYHHFYVRPMAELEKLKADGIPERLPEDWQRKQAAAAKK